MNESISHAAFFESYWIYLVAPFVLVVAFYGIRRIAFLRTFYSKLLWLVAIIEVCVYVAAAYSLGLLIEGVILGLGLDWEFLRDGDLPTLLLHMAGFAGAARFVEVWLLSFDPADDRLSLSRLTRTVLYGAGLLTGALTFLVSHGYTFLSISTGALAAVLAFALQRSMGDLIAGVAMTSEGVFRIGDWVRLEDGMEAEIVDIDWRATHLKGWDRAVTVIPNASLASQKLVKLPRKKQAFAQSYELSVSGAQDPELVKNLLDEAARRSAGVLDRPAPVIRLADISSDPYQYSLWVHFENYMAMFAARDELFSNIHTEFRNAGFSISPEVLDLRNSKADTGVSDMNHDRDTTRQK